MVRIIMRPLVASARAAALVLLMGSPALAGEDPAATPPVVSPYVRTDWMIIPSEEIIYRYYPKFAADKGVVGRVLLDCDIAQGGASAASGLSNCQVREEKPDHYGFGDAAVQLAQKEIHLWSQAVADTPLLGQVSVSVAFNPKTATSAEAPAGAAPASTPAAPPVSKEVSDWSQSIKKLDWNFAAPAENQMTFWKADRRLGPDAVTGSVRYEYFLGRTEEGQTVRSSEVAYAFDCKANTFKTLSITTHGEPNLEGASATRTFKDATTLKITPGSVLDDAETRICAFDTQK